MLYGSTLHCPECRTPTPFLRIGLLLSPIRHYFPDCGRLNEPALGSAQQDSHLPRISRAAPHCLRLWLDRLFLPGRRDHCETGRHACFWLDDDRYAPFLPFIDAEAESDAGGPGASAASLLPPRQESVCRCCSSPDITVLLRHFSSSIQEPLISCGIIVIHPISD